MWVAAVLPVLCFASLPFFLALYDNALFVIDMKKDVTI